MKNDPSHGRPCTFECMHGFALTRNDCQDAAQLRGRLEQLQADLTKTNDMIDTSSAAALRRQAGGGQS